MAGEIQLQNGEIYISPTNWARLNDRYSRDRIKEMISDFIDHHNLPMPMVEVTREDSDNSLIELKVMDEQELWIDSPWFIRHECDPKWFKLDQVIMANKTGNRFPNYYHQESRWHCDSINSPSPYRSWGIKKFRMTLLNALWSLKVKFVNNAVLRSCIGMRKYIASQFRPSTAKLIYNHFESKHVLDISSGWGDRLTGFLASDALSYTGIDPNARLVKGYQDQIRSARRLKIYKDVELLQACSEEVCYSDKFDLVFTSPPYYCAERYTHENNQSFKKFRKLEDWLKSYLFISLKEAWSALKVGGYMIINISDVYLHHVINRICDPMNEFINTLKGSEYIGAIGYQMAVRPNSAATRNGNGIFCEPMWCWRKN